MLRALIGAVLSMMMLAAHANTPAVGTAASSTRTSSKALLGALAVRPEHAAGYERSAFKLWDAQGGGCDTRDRVLITEAVDAPQVSSTCAISGGRWRSPYDGVITTDPSAFDIDHLVPLAEAWQSGAWSWSARTREAYANDLGYPADLIAVSAHANRSKGDSEPSAYLPPRMTFDCTYEAWWVAVKWRWRLAVDTAEKSWLTSHLRQCGWPTVRTPTRATGGTASASGASITAINFDAPSGLDAEWIRLKNTTSRTVTLTGWTVHDASTHVYRFGTFSLTAGSTVTLHTGSGTDTASDRYWGAGGYIWNNDGDRATLRNGQGSIVDSCAYTSADDPQVTC